MNAPTRKKIAELLANFHPTMKKSTHGGTRANAGRKKRTKPVLVAHTVRLKPDVSERLQTLKARLGISHPALLERLLDGFDLLTPIMTTAVAMIDASKVSPRSVLFTEGPTRIRDSISDILGGRGHE